VVVEKLAEEAETNEEVNTMRYSETATLGGRGLRICLWAALAGAWAGASISDVNGAEQPKTYAGTIYVAGHGGHFAQVELSIDPSNQEDPIQIKPLPLKQAKLTVSKRKHKNGQSQYKLHDARLDGNKLYWSTYNTDNNNKVHYGVIDLTTRKVTSDIAVPVDPRATKPAVKPDAMPYYCASGLTPGHFMPMSMTHEAYVTVVDRADMDKYKNVFLDNILPNANYKYLHGSTSPDGSKFLAVVNVADAPYGGLTGESRLYVLDAKALEKGKVVKLAEGELFGDGTGPFGATITFRSSWTPDGSKILESGADRFWVLDSKTLKPLNGEDGDLDIAGQNHDALATTDGKYAILTVRVLPYEEGSADEGKMDGHIQLYDIENSEAIGNSVSVCNSCHIVEEEENYNAVLCGLDGIVTPQ
jgi:hypothetical protein